MDMQSIMVVGGSGFIGQHVTRAVAALGHKVHATHTQGRSLPALPSVTWVSCDLSSAHATASWPPSCSTVIFLAQAREHRNFPSCCRDVFAVNVAALQQTLEYALRARAQRLLYASTGSVYAPASSLAEEKDPIHLADARSFYVASKLASEVLLGPYAKLLPVVILRLFMPYGIGQKPDMLFPQLMDKVRTRKPIHLHGPEGLRANPVAVADVAEGFARCLTLQESVTMNLAGPEILTLRQIGEAMGRMLGQKPLFQVERTEPPNFVGATSFLRQVLDWAPGIRLENGLRLWTQQRAYPRAG